MSDSGSLGEDALKAAIMEAVRRYMQAPTPKSTITVLTPRDTAKHLSCSERTLERRREEGDGPPYVKIGGAVRYPLAALEEWLTEQTRRSTSQSIAPTRPRRKARSASRKSQERLTAL
jgi:predicted DNA-binding transcriptional regulator AlpA